ncbi:Zn-ribbon domain-containing OB-fold protein [Paracandidimonas soli]|uniref:ChsH2 C-terminal OB-fold domain-containing protein n=1 Tax=Paracandidimonas soli TaxID=1917182 RepID=A0A4R3VGU6_9BURK|nr:OB-fold domain-containing protein [Paracandidimonas soli]TCV03253.1 hypothetical protein EV686_101717 [Paracandidimonas soli]
MAIALDRLWTSDPQRALLASRNRKNGEWDFPVVPENSPRAADFDAVPVKNAGVLYSFTIIHPSPKSGQAPYALGYVDFDGPVRIFGRLAGTDRPEIGSRYVPVPDEAFGYVFNLVQG